MAAVAELIQTVELAKHLRRRLQPRHAAKQLDDVTELAHEGAAPRELHADVQVTVEVEEVETRDRRLGHVRLLLTTLVGPLFGTGRAIGEPAWQGDLSLAKHQVVGTAIDVWARRRVGAADHDRLAARLGGIDHLHGGSLLRDHAAGEHDVRPLDLGRVEGRCVAVDQPHLPVIREHGRDRDHAKRRRRVLRADQLTGCAVVPERVRAELRVHEQAAGGWSHRQADS